MTERFQLKAMIDGALMASVRLGRPLGVKRLASVLGVPIQTVDAVLDTLAHEMENSGRALYLVRKRGRVHARLKPAQAEIVKRIHRQLARQEKRKVKESEEEVLSAVTHNPGITSKEICSIAGRDCNKEVAKLHKNGWIRSERRVRGSRPRRWYVTDEAIGLKDRDNAYSRDTKPNSTST